MIKISVFIILIIFFESCNNKDGIPSGILKPDKMQAVFWDIMRAETYTAQYIKKDSTKNPIIENATLQQQIFATHHVTRLDFYESYRFYNVHAQLMRVLLDSITTIREREKYTILYSKPVIKPFSLEPLPPEPPIIPIPGVKFVTKAENDTTQKVTHKFVPLR